MNIDNLKLSYDEFVLGIANRQIRVEVIDNSNYALLYNTNFVMWLMRVFLLLIITPYFLIPYLAYHFKVWWLLLGFIGILFGSIIHGINKRTPNPIKNMLQMSAVLLLLTGVLIYFLGIWQPVVFSVTCLTYSFISSEIGNNVYDEIAKNNLISNEDLYNQAVEKNIIRITYI